MSCSQQRQIRRGREDCQDQENTVLLNVPLPVLAKPRRDIPERSDLRYSQRRTKLRLSKLLRPDRHPHADISAILVPSHLPAPYRFSCGGGLVSGGLAGAISSSWNWRRKKAGSSQPHLSIKSRNLFTCSRMRSGSIMASFHLA